MISDLREIIEQKLIELNEKGQGTKSDTKTPQLVTILFKIDEIKKYYVKENFEKFFDAISNEPENPEDAWEYLSTIEKTISELPKHIKVFDELLIELFNSWNVFVNDFKENGKSDFFSKQNKDDTLLALNELLENNIDTKFYPVKLPYMLKEFSVYKTLILWSHFVKMESENFTNWSLLDAKIESKYSKVGEHDHLISGFDLYKSIIENSLDFLVDFRTLLEFDKLKINIDAMKLNNFFEQILTSELTNDLFAKLIESNSEEEHKNIVKKLIQSVRFFDFPRTIASALLLIANEDLFKEILKISGKKAVLPN